MRIHLIRHGIAIDRDDPECPAEAERYLTPEGISRTEQAMVGLRALGARPEVILTSVFVRSYQTAEIVARALGVSEKAIRTTEALLPGAEPSHLFRDLRKMEENEVACCGHAPNLDDILASAVGARDAFTALKKAGVACLDIEPARAGHGLLVWLYPAGSLRRLSR